MYKPPKNFDFPETQWSFRFVWFEELPWFSYSRWEENVYCPPFILFSHKVVGSSNLENCDKKYSKYSLERSRDSKKNHPQVGKSGLTNSKNFVELLMYRVRGGDKTLGNHFLNAPRNAKYTSPDI